MCNQSAFIGKSPDINKLKLLQVLGRERGKDSCGIAYNNTINYGVWDHELKTDLSDSFKYVQYKPWPLSEEIKTPIIQHTRSKTVGAATAKNAHPFIFKEEGKPSMYFMHNGSLKSYYSLAKKYDLSWGDFSVDSQLLGHLIYTEGYDVLKEYDGYASVSFYFDDEPDSLYIWKGCAYKKERGKKVLYEERPYHYYWDEEDEGFYFASLEEHLNAISNLKGDIKRVPGNKVFRFNRDGTIELVETIARDKDMDTFTYSYSATKNKMDRGTKNAYNGYSNYNGYGGYGNVGTTSYSGGEPAKEIHPGVSAKGRVYYYNGRYYHNGERLDGEVYINNFDYLVKTPEHGFKFYFYKGLWLRDKYIYQYYLDYQPSTSAMHQYHPAAVGLSKGGVYYVDGKPTYSDTIMNRFMYYELITDTSGKLRANSWIDEGRRKKLATEFFEKYLSQEEEDDIIEKIIRFNTLHNTIFDTLEECEKYFQEIYHREPEEDWKWIFSTTEDMKVEFDLEVFNHIHATYKTDKRDANEWHEKRFGVPYKKEWKSLLTTIK